MTVSTPAAGLLLSADHMRSDTPTPTPAPLPAPQRLARSLAELAAAQGVTGPQDLDALLGAGADLWHDDADFEAFLAGLRESRCAGG
jgi:hypothetical protein